jgi:hypothetical protein
MRRTFNDWFSKKKQPSPKQTDMQFDLRCLPARFHEQVVDLEMQIEGREYQENENELVAMISRLMGLYSVRTDSI